MNVDEFREYLRDLQNSNSLIWPNDYFAWEKPDGSLLMVGINSTQREHILLYEYRPFLEAYGGYYYSIGTWGSHQDTKGNPYDPVEKLVDKISDCKYLGSWRDPDVLMDPPYGFSKVIACGRWDLAKKHILQQEKKPSLSEQIFQAEDKASLQDVLKGREVPTANHDR